MRMTMTKGRSNMGENIIFSYLYNNVLDYLSPHLFFHRFERADIPFMGGIFIS
jgi:hypothetical protein